MSNFGIRPSSNFPRVQAMLKSFLYIGLCFLFPVSRVFIYLFSCSFSIFVYSFVNHSNSFSSAYPSPDVNNQHGNFNYVSGDWLVKISQDGRPATSQIWQPICDNLWKWWLTITFIFARCPLPLEVLIFCYFQENSGHEMEQVLLPSSGLLTILTNLTSVLPRCAD